MSLTESLLAGGVLAVCVLLLLRLLLGVPRRARIDAAMARAANGVRRRVLRLWRLPAQRRAAAREADEAIRRAARTEARREGNVIRPEAFREPRKPH